MRTRLRQLSERSRRAALPCGAEDFPPAVQRFFTNVSGYEPAEFIRRLVPATARSVLVIGTGAGRDTFWLALHGLEVISIDIARQADIPDLVLADMACLPFASTRFDVVVVADALEHSFADLEAIREFRRVLTERGALVLNIPFGDDAGEHHVRVYTEATLRRLLASVGFQIEERRYRGVFPLVEQKVPGARAVLHAVGMLGPVFGRNLYHPVLTWCINEDWKHGRRAWLRRAYRAHGAYIRARPVLEPLDYRRVNLTEYEHQARHFVPSDVTAL